MNLKRVVFLFFILQLFMAACGVQTEPRAQSKIPIPITPQPTRFNLGKCVDVRQPTPASNQISLFPPVQTQDHILGKSTAYVTILVYSDFQCASCAQIASLLKAYVNKYPEEVRVVFRNFPLISIHDKAALSAQSAEAAGLQGKFWEMHDFLFSNQTIWQNKQPDEFQKWVIANASALSLEPNRFESDVNSPEIKSIVQKSWEDGLKIKLPGAPVILINGEIIKWQPNLLNQIEGILDLARLQQKQFSTCPPIVIKPLKKYSAILNTSKGIVKINLLSDKAPNTVNNFIFLAQKGWFDNIPFNLVIKGLMVQTGDPSGTGLGGPGYFIPTEQNSFIFDRAGMVAMANSGPDTNGSQFFITLSPASALNNKYSIFGEVTTGIEILNNFKSHDPNTQSEAETLLSVKIEEK